STVPGSDSASTTTPLSGMAAPMERMGIFSLLCCAKGVIIREELSAPSAAGARTFRLFLPLSRTLRINGALETKSVGKHHGSVAIRFLSERLECPSGGGQFVAGAAGVVLLERHLREIQARSRRFERRSALFERFQGLLTFARRFGGTTPITRETSGGALTECDRIGVPGTCRHLEATLDEYRRVLDPFVEPQGFSRKR